MNNLSYKQKEDIMEAMFVMHQSPAGFRSTYKGAPIYNYENIKQFIDFTKYYVMFRGPRKHGASSTRKCDAHSFDVYQHSDRDMRNIRAEREAFKRGVVWAKDNA
jgi:abortive infection bacteriophage resistance protein